MRTRINDEGSGWQGFEGEAFGRRQAISLSKARRDKRMPAESWRYSAAAVRTLSKSELSLTAPLPCSFALASVQSSDKGWLVTLP